MGSDDDFIPSNNAEFDVWFFNLKDYVNKKCMPDAPEWTHIPADALAGLNQAYTQWHAAYLITLKPCTKEDRDERNRIRDRVKKEVIRPFVKAYLRYHPAVTKDDKERMGLHLDKPRRDEIPPPATVPELSPKAGAPRQVIIPYRDKGSTRRGKPADVYGIEIRWAAQNATHFELGSLRKAQTPRINVWSFAPQNSAAICEANCVSPAEKHRGGTLQLLLRHGKPPDPDLRGGRPGQTALPDGPLGDRAGGDQGRVRRYCNGVCSLRTSLFPLPPPSPLPLNYL